MSVIDYTNISGSRLPNEIMERTILKNITDDKAPIVNQIKQLQAEGKYAEAASVVDRYDLKDYILSADTMNFLDEETRNLEILCMSRRQSVFYMENEPLFIKSKGDVWIGG